jgi:hypothetical protein
VLGAERLKGRHGLLPPIVPKDELVQVRLKQLATDAVMGADQPMLKVPDGAVRQGHDGLGALAGGAGGMMSSSNWPSRSLNALNGTR